MGEPSSSAASRWRLRSVPEDLAQRYRAEGWWNDATLGGDGGRRPGPAWGDDGVPGALAGAARGRAPSPTSTGRRASLAGALRAQGVGPGDVVVFQLPELGGGRHHLLGRRLPRCGRRARSCTSTGPRRSSTSCGATAPDVVVTADRLRPRRLPGHLRRPAAPTDPGPLWLVVGETPGADLPAAATPFDVAARRRARRRPGRGRSRRAGRHRLHLRHHPRPQGRRALAPHDRLRDPPARLHVPRRAARRRSPARRSGTSSGCSTPSSCPCCGSGRST